MPYYAITCFLADRRIGEPAVGHSVDFLFRRFSALVPRLLANKGMEVFPRFCEIVGITLKAGKSEVGVRVTFMGIQGWFPTAENRYALHISIPGRKREAWAALLAD